VPLAIIKENEMGGSRSTTGEQRRAYSDLGVKSKERRSLGKPNLNETRWEVWTGFISLIMSVVTKDSLHIILYIF
jgi:hypothetical protein